MIRLLVFFQIGLMGINLGGFGAVWGQSDTSLNLIQAIRQKQTNQAISLIRQNRNLDVMDRNGRTALMWAAFRGNEPVTSALLKRRVKVDAQDQDGMTALMYAAMEGYHGVVEQLLRQQAQTQVRDKRGRTVLMYASLYNRPRTLQTLIDYGANPNIPDANGMTAQDVASAGNFSQVRTLLQQNQGLMRSSPPTPPLKPSSPPANPVSTVQENEVIQTQILASAAEVVQSREPSSVPMPSSTPMSNMQMQTAKVMPVGEVPLPQTLPEMMAEGDLDAVQDHFDQLHPINERDTQGMTALMWAARYGQTEIAIWLIDRGADAEMREYQFNWTAMMWAARYGHTDVVRLLLDFGANIYVQDRHSWTVLDLALYYHQKETVEFLEAYLAHLP